MYLEYLYVFKNVILMFLLNDQEYSEKVYLVNRNWFIEQWAAILHAFVFVDKFMFSEISHCLLQKDQAAGKFLYPS